MKFYLLLSLQLHFIKGLQPALKDRLNVIVTDRHLTTTDDILEAAIRIEKSLADNAKKGLEQYRKLQMN